MKSGHGAIPFRKVHGLGNDFILIDLTEASEFVGGIDWNSRARAWCDRHLGIGADGLLLLTPPTADAHVRMRIFNPDGREAEMCGNGIRCVARHLALRSPATARGLRVETGRGVLSITSDVRDGAFVSATVGMGTPRILAASMPLPSDLARRWGHWSSSAGLVPDITSVSMGNPHAVVFCADASRVPLSEAGPQLEGHPSFPGRTNAHFVHAASRSRAIMRTWERGAGPTLACGTGACAVLVAGVVRGVLDERATIALPGGELQIDWTGRGEVRMTGPAAEVFAGEAAID